MTLSRKVYIACLFGVLSYSIIRSYLIMLSEPTTFEEFEVPYASTFPSFTICSRKNDGKMDNFTDFNDINKQMNIIKDSGFGARFEHWGKGVTT